MLAADSLRVAFVEAATADGIGLISIQCQIREIFNPGRITEFSNLQDIVAPFEIDDIAHFLEEKLRRHIQAHDGESGHFTCFCRLGESDDNLSRVQSVQFGWRNGKLVSQELLQFRRPRLSSQGQHEKQ